MLLFKLNLNEGLLDSCKLKFCTSFKQRFIISCSFTVLQNCSHGSCPSVVGSVMGKMRRSYKNLGCKRKCKIPFGKYGPLWEGNIKVDPE